MCSVQGRRKAYGKINNAARRHLCLRHTWTHRVPQPDSCKYTETAAFPLLHINTQTSLNTAPIIWRRRKKSLSRSWWRQQNTQLQTRVLEQTPYNCTTNTLQNQRFPSNHRETFRLNFQWELFMSDEWHWASVPNWHLSQKCVTLTMACPVGLSKFV